MTLEKPVSIADALKLALEHHEAGRFPEADQIYKQILASEPENVNALFLHGTIASQTGLHDDAIALLTRASARAPKEAKIFLNLANSLRALERFGEAEAACRKALKLNPEYGKAHNSLGLVHLDAGQIDQAIDAFQRAVILQPDDAEFHNNLGNALADKGEFDDASIAYRRALDIRPNYADPLNNLGSVLIENRNYDQAVEALECALRLKPDYLEALINLGRALNLLNRPKEAEEHFRAALKLKPANPNAWVGLANALEFTGRIDEAIAAFRQAIQVQPDFGSAFRQLVPLETRDNVCALIPVMEQILSQPDLDPTHELELCFALGRANENVRDHDRAFQYYARGGKLKRASLDYNVADDEALVDRIIKVFTPELFADHEDQGCPSDVPVFIVGMPRSGTSMAEQILASHSKVFGAGELTNLAMTAHLVDQPDSSMYPETISTLDGAELSALGDAYLNVLTARAPGFDRVIDKLPANFLYTGFIRLIFPRAKVIHCIRNPLDTCLSCHNLLFGVGQKYSYDLAELGRHYRAYRRLMDHFHKVFPGWILDVHYENVIENQERETRRLLDFLDLPWEDACLTFHETNRAIQTASASQIRKPLYKTSVARWKDYAEHLDPLRIALGPLAADN